MRLPKNYRHGEYRTYRTVGCRCDECRAANAQHVRDARARVGGDYRSNQMHRRAYRRAETALRERHRAEFAEFLRLELAKEHREDAA